MRLGVAELLRAFFPVNPASAIVVASKQLVTEVKVCRSLMRGLGAWITQLLLW